MTKSSADLQSKILRIARLHFLYIFAFVGAIIVHDSWQLITPEAVLQRWSVAAVMLVITTLVWYIARNSLQTNYYKALVFVLIAIDIAVATFLVYAERGMASRGVALYAVPLVVSAVLNSRAAVLATASICTAAYSLSAVRYFVDFFNEGYKIELYSTIGFYSVMFFIVAGLLLVLLRPSSNK